jgi:hypothetical protein
MKATPIRSWLGQVTTGIGALIAAPVVIALLTSQITPSQAVPGIVAAVIGLMWPENRQFAASAQTLASDAEVLIPQLLTAYRTGLQHGAQATAVPLTPTPALAPKLAPTPAVLPAAPAIPQAA